MALGRGGGGLGMIAIKHNDEMEIEWKLSFAY